MNKTNQTLIGYILIHCIITYVLGSFAFGAARIFDYLLIFIAIEVVWILSILIDTQGRVSINTSLLEGTSNKQNNNKEYKFLSPKSKSLLLLNK